MDRIRFQVGEGSITYVTSPDDARAFVKALRAAGDAALADRIAGAMATSRKPPILLTRDEGAESALAVLDASADEPWHSVTFGALHEALRSYLDE